MAPFASLPQIVLAANFAKQNMCVQPNGLERMADEGTVPQPIALRGVQPVWSADTLDEWFGQIQAQQSAYAAISDHPGVYELDTLGAYVCPSRDSSFIWARRPSKLALYKSGKPRNASGNYEVDVYDVEFIQTQRGVMSETLIVHPGVDPKSVTAIPWSSVRPNESHSSTTDPLTLMKLAMGSRQVLELRRGMQRGGTISTESLIAGIGNAGGADHFEGGLVHLNP